MITEREEGSTDMSHLEVFEYTSSNFEAPVNIFRFSLRYAIEQAKMTVKIFIYYKKYSIATFFLMKNLGFNNISLILLKRIKLYRQEKLVLLFPC